ncbi:hypothetical protein BLNAU_16487 [Blattamonas nauphoetae]|uniref:Uncharacterized protein n=1 Tax=Blattamonas nauphoetae TaxID=2049346 RepID=A0ABQ9XBF2_9EUKA|nr:hypothetical protein BLNAU_16487 [Blattamonas nauphoetae]
MEILISLYGWCSPKVRLTLVHADLVPQLIMTLNPLSLSFTEAADIHEYLMNSIVLSFKQITPYGLAKLGIKDRNEQQAVHKTVFTQVLVPSEKYICHLCTNRNSIINGKQSESFLELLAQLLEQSLYYQPTLDFVLHLPVFLPIPSCLSFFENERSIRQFLRDLVVTLREWNEKGGEVRQIWKTVHRLLRMEDIEDVIDTKLGNDKNASYGRSLVANSISLNNLQGMNIPEQE